MWPWTEEARAGAVSRDATEVAISAMAARAAGRDARPETLAALEIAASLVGRAFASATVEGPEAARLLTRATLMLIGRSLVLRGELVMLPEGSALVPAASFDIRGGPNDWAYRCDFAGPSSSVSRFLTAQSVLHFRVNTDPARPWKGQAAHSLATATAATAANAEATAASEARIAISRLIPVASTLTPDQRDDTTTTLADELKRGGYFALSLIGARPGAGERMNRVSVEAVQPDPSEGHLTLRREAALELIEAAWSARRARRSARRGTGATRRVPPLRPRDYRADGPDCRS